MSGMARSVEPLHTWMTTVFHSNALRTLYLLGFPVLDAVALGVERAASVASDGK